MSTEIIGRLTAKLAVGAAAMATVCGLAILPAGSASACTTYMHGTAWYSDQVGGVDMQFGYYTTGLSVQPRYVNATPNGIGMSVTWSNSYRESNGNLDFGFNTSQWLGPWLPPATGGYRIVIGPAGQVVNQYAWGFGASAAYQGPYYG